MDKSVEAGGEIAGATVIAGDVAGRDNRQEFSRRSDMAGGNVMFQSQDNAVLWREIVALGDKVSDLRFLIDDLPNRVRTLENVSVKIDPVPIPVAVAFPPTFWALVILIGLVLGTVAFFVGQRF